MMIGEGLELMVAGMGVVFLFLILMVIVMNISSFILKRFDKPQELPAGAGGTPDQLTQVAVAIAAAKRHMQG
jgi:oxaloacetate decarboxylase gamma subunit